MTTSTEQITGETAALDLMRGYLAAAPEAIVVRTRPCDTGRVRPSRPRCARHGDHMHPRHLLRALTLPLLCLCAVGCVVVPSASDPPAPAAEHPQIAHAVPLWPAPVEPSAITALGPAGTLPPPPSAPAHPAPRHVEAKRAAPGPSEGRPKAPRRRAAAPPPRASYDRPRTPRRAPARTAPRRAPAAPRPAKRQRYEYDARIICSWGADAGLDPATVAACRRQHG
ncbi:hypothetical protein ACIP93_33155 [Streptomyces sp. NPDC088745]|uniref:hypothetical protein n=1 Tax=Streptomyces sp. NPDC088745 TaxID=3365884 RepID=UPI0038175529